MLYSYSKPCMVCGEGVPVGINSSDTVVCDKCIAAILKLRKQKENDNSLKTYIVRFIDKDGNAFYVTKSPKHVTSSTITSMIRVLRDEFIEKAYKFNSDEHKAQFFTRTKASNLCKSFHLLQEHGLFNQFVKAEVVKDNQVTFYWDFEKYKLEEKENDI